MSDASDFAENEIADWFGANGAPGVVANVYVKLHLGAPGELGTANAAGETTRVEAIFNPASGGVVGLTGTISWTNVSNTEIITHVSLWDNLTAGNNLAAGVLGAPVALSVTDDFDITALTVTVT